MGNLPYNISTPLLFHLLAHSDAIQDMVFMLQREVAERIVAAPSTRDYGRLSVMLQYRCTATELFPVAPHAFRPEPQVHSTVIRLVPARRRPRLRTTACSSAWSGRPSASAARRSAMP